MDNTVIEKDLFQLGMWWRIFYGSLRIVIGVVLLRFVHLPFSEALKLLLHSELVEDPSDTVLFNVLLFFQHHPFHISYFLALYFIFWGVVDVGLSWALLKHQLWAFPFSLALIISFMFYEVVRFFHTHSPSLIALLIVDAFVFWLIYREYQRIRRRNTLTV